MAKGFYTWSTTAASNGNADSSINYVEGQAPSTLNDSARSAMARLREYANDTSGMLVTGGTSSAYTLATFQVFDSLVHLANQVVAFTPNVANAASATLNVDGLGAKAILTASGAPVLAGALNPSSRYAAMYDNVSGSFYLLGGGTASTQAATDASNKIATTAFVGGAWTDYTMTATATSGTITSYGVTNARYKQIGKTVLWAIDFTIFDNGTGAVTLNVNLPVACKTGAVFIATGRETAVNGIGLTGTLTASTASLQSFDNRYPTNGANNRIVMTGVYETN